jgi:hypothetical protein
MVNAALGRMNPLLIFLIAVLLAAKVVRVIVLLLSVTSRLGFAETDSYLLF